MRERLPGSGEPQMTAAVLEVSDWELERFRIGGCVRTQYSPVLSHHYAYHAVPHDQLSRPPPHSI
jgi:hypothetical protein